MELNDESKAKSPRDEIAIDDSSGLLTFFGLTFLYSWVLWAPMIAKSIGISNVEAPSSLYLAGGFGPCIAAVLISAVKHGKLGIASLIRRLLIWRVHIKWYGVALFWMAGIRLAAIAVHAALGGSTQFHETAWVKPPLLFLIGLVVPLAEEPGWRGFALPRLLARKPPLGASVILGLIWGLWHLPLFWLEGTSYSKWRIQFGLSMAFILFMASVIAMSIMFTYLFLRTKGSLLIAFLFHDAINTSADLLSAPYVRAGIQRPLWLAIGILVLTAAFIVGTGGLRFVKRQR